MVSRSCMVVHFNENLRWEKIVVYFLCLNLLFIKMPGRFNFCEAWTNISALCCHWTRSSLHTKAISLLQLTAADGVDRKRFLKYYGCSVWKRLSDSVGCVPTKGKRGFRGFIVALVLVTFLLLVSLCVNCVRWKAKIMTRVGSSGNRAQLPQFPPCVKSKIMILYWKGGKVETN